MPLQLGRASQTPHELLSLVLILAALAASAVATAQPVPAQEQAAGESEDPSPKAPPASAPAPRPESLRDRLLDQPHEFVSRRVETYARRLDEFFSDPNRAYDSTGSSLQLRGHFTFFEGGITQGKADIRASVSLPNTEDRLKLIVQRGLQAGTETAAERDIRNAGQATAPGVPQDESFYLGLKSFAAEVLQATLSAEGGVKLRIPLEPYVRLRAFRDFTVSAWSIRFSETPLWQRSEGSSAASEMTALRPFNEQWQLRLTSKATWRSTTHYFDLAQIESLYYIPDKRTAYTFELGAFAPSDRSEELRTYSITLRARRQIYRDWLYLEITPQVLYRQTSDFHPEYSLMLQLETLFGDRYLRR